MGILKAQNQALIEENSRLTGLTKMLLSSPQFKDMLADLSANPAKLSQLQTAGTPRPQPQVQAPLQMTEEERSLHFHQQFQQSQGQQSLYAV